MEISGPGRNFFTFSPILSVTSGEAYTELSAEEEVNIEGVFGETEDSESLLTRFAPNV